MTRLIVSDRSAMPLALISVLGLSFAIVGCGSSLPHTTNERPHASPPAKPRTMTPLANLAPATCAAPEVYFPEPFEPDPAREVLSPATRIMSESIDCVREKLARAREAKASAQVRCLNDKLNQLGFARRNFDERIEKLDRALRNDAWGAAAQEYASLKSICERSRTVVSEVEFCSGLAQDSALASVELAP